MNCEAYIAYYWNGQINLYPNNIEPSLLTDIFTNLPSGAGYDTGDWLAIKRKDDMVYYAFIVTLAGELQDRLCLMVGLNNILITDILALNTFMRHTLRDLAQRYRIARYDISLGAYTCHEVDGGVAKLSEAQEILRDRFNERFDSCGSQPGPRDYTSQPGVDVYTMLPDGRTRHASASSGQRASSLPHSVEAGNTVLIQSRHEEASRYAGMGESTNKEREQPGPTSDTQQECTATDDAPRQTSNRPTPSPANGDKPASSNRIWSILSPILALALVAVGILAIADGKCNRNSSDHDSDTVATVEAVAEEPDPMDMLSENQQEIVSLLNALSEDYYNNPSNDDFMRKAIDTANTIQTLIHNLTHGERKEVKNNYAFVSALERIKEIHEREDKRLNECAAPGDWDARYEFEYSFDNSLDYLSDLPEFLDRPRKDDPAPAAQETPATPAVDAQAPAVGEDNEYPENTLVDDSAWEDEGFGGPDDDWDYNAK